MNNEQGYNGWANRETWNVMLWLNNDEFLYNKALGWLKMGKQKGKLPIPAEAAQQLVKYAFCMGLSNFRNMGLHCKYGFTPDGVSLDDASIDWQEIADALNDWVEE